MYPSVWDTLEAVKVVHSFLEWSALLFFVGVVACDVLLHLFESSDGPSWAVGWKKRNLEMNVGSRRLKATLPSFGGQVKLKSLLKLNSLFWFGIAIGLEVAALPYSDRTDELSASELTEARRQSVKALTFASLANGEAGEARKTAGAANERASKANERASKNEKEAAQLRKDSEGLKKAAEDERSARIKIEELLAWRNLTPEQVETIRRESRRAPRRRVSIESIVSDPEGNEYAEQLAEALRSGGWEVAPPGVAVVAAPLPIGVRMQVADRNNLAAGALQHILGDVGIDAVGVLSPTMEPDVISLIVGIKPRPQNPAAK